MTTRKYSSVYPDKQLGALLTSSSTTLTLNDASSILNSFPYTLVVDPNTNKEEIVTVTAGSGTSLTVTRGQDGTTAVEHANGAVVKHMVTARDLQEPQDHIAATSAVHGITGSFVGTTDTQTLTNKTLTSPKINDTVAITSTSTELNYTAGVTSSIQTQLNSKASSDSPTFTGTVVLPSTTSIGNVSSTEIGYVDGVTSSIQTQINTISSALAALEVFPKGMITPFAGPEAKLPVGWLMCDGSAVSRTTYSELFTVIGTVYGTGDGSTTFTLPDLRGRSPLGAGSGTGLTARSLGSTLGAETLPAHTHTIDHDHASFSTTDGAGNHDHPVYVDVADHQHNIYTRDTSSTNHNHNNTSNQIASAPGSGYSLDRNARADQVTGGGHRAYGGTYDGGRGAHNHTIDVPAFSGTSGSTGTGSHGVMQPSTVVNFIIKY